MIEKEVSPEKVNVNLGNSSSKTLTSSGIWQIFVF